MSHPYTSGAIKGFPRHLQRKSETPCERTPPPSPFCSSAPRSEPRGWQGTARKPSRGKHQHHPPEPAPRNHIWAPSRWCPAPRGMRAGRVPSPGSGSAFTCKSHRAKLTARAAERCLAHGCLAERGEILGGFCWQPATSRRS